MGVVLAPIVEGKIDIWKTWIAEMNGPLAQSLRILPICWSARPVSLRVPFHGSTPCPVIPHFTQG